MTFDFNTKRPKRQQVNIEFSAEEYERLLAVGAAERVLVSKAARSLLMGALEEYEVQKGKGTK